MLWCLRNLNRNLNTIHTHCTFHLPRVLASSRLVPVASNKNLLVMALEKTRSTRGRTTRQEATAKEPANGLDESVGAPGEVSTPKRARRPRAPSTPAAPAPQRLRVATRGNGVVVQESNQATADDACAAVKEEPPEGPPSKKRTRTKKEYLELDITGNSEYIRRV